MKRILLTVASLFLFSSAVVSQTLPDSFIYKISPVQDVQTIHLTLSNYAIKHETEAGLPFQALTIAVQPTVGKFVLFFFNVQSEYQFEAQTAVFAKLKLDNEELRIPEVIKAVKLKSGKLFVESVALHLTEEQFEKTLGAKNIRVSFGEVSYQLDQDNLDSFAYAKRLLPHDMAYVVETYGSAAERVPSSSTPSSSAPSSSGPSSSPSRIYILGPRGGCYYLSGKSKVYVSRSYCN